MCTHELHWLHEFYLWYMDVSSSFSLSLVSYLNKGVYFVIEWNTGSTYVNYCPNRCDSVKYAIPLPDLGTLHIHGSGQGMQNGIVAGLLCEGNYHTVTVGPAPSLIVLIHGRGQQG